MIAFAFGHYAIVIALSTLTVLGFGHYIPMLGFGHYVGDIT